MIFNYNSFLESLYLEYIDESIIYFTDNFRKILKRIGSNPIALDMIGIEATDIKPDVTFVDVDKDGYLSFITSTNAMKLINARWPSGAVDPFRSPNKMLATLIWNDDVSDENGISTKSRNLIKVGKLINKIFPDKYKDKEVEEFVNIFKSTTENLLEKFMIVEGNDIDYWYNSDNYRDMSGTLGNSCMKNKSGGGYFKIYTENPEVCRMLILVEDGKLKGRALLWKVTASEYNFSYFLDRQYTNNDSDVIKFRNYAKENGWAYKTNNNHSSLKRVTFEDKSMDIDMMVNLKSTTYEEFPYVDTFRRYDPKNYKLFNDSEEEGNKGQYLLEDTSGGFSEIEEGKFSTYYDCYVDEERAIWSTPVDSYLDINQSVEVTRGPRRSRGYWPSDHGNLYYDAYHGDYIIGDDSIYSRRYGHRILQEDSVIVISVITESLLTRTDYIYHDDDDSAWVRRSSLNDSLWFQTIDVDYEVDGVLEEIMLKVKSDNTWVPKSLSIEVFETVDSEYQVEYLSKIDAYILGAKINNYFKVTDVISYDTLLSKVKYNGRTLISFMQKKCDDIINNKQLSLFKNDKLTEVRLEEVLNRKESLDGEKYIF